jgi:hypothetical protein
LNDSSEFAYALDLTAEQLRKHRSHILAVGSDQLFDSWNKCIELARTARVFIASFCEDGDLLSQWRAYGSVSGCAIGLSPLHLARVALAQPDPSTVVKCIYDRKEQSDFVAYAITFLLDEFGRMTSAGTVPPEVSVDIYARHFLGSLLPIAATFKHPSFQEENEWRLVIRGRGPGIAKVPIEFRPGRRAIIPYVTITFESAAKADLVGDLVIGPNPHPEQARNAAGEMLGRHGFRNDLGRSSDIPFRDW